MTRQQAMWEAAQAVLAGPKPTTTAAFLEAGGDAERARLVAWLRAEAQLCDCFARSSGECACGAWDAEPGERSYKRVSVEDLADAIERGEYWKDRHA
jgi:hypothetical protein